MNTFIGDSVKLLCDKYKEKISEVKILLPSKRSQLFFNIKLSEYFKSTAIWQPKYISIDSLCEDITKLKIGNKIKLIVELYNIYKTLHTENFDTFYSWGEMIIADFDAIDNYRIDARRLYCNINDLYEIDALYDDIAQEQKEIINNFWKIFNNTKSSSDKKNFLQIWNTLFDIYTLYKANLLSMGIGFKGMIYRQAAEILLSKKENYFAGEYYAVIGFNALSNSEKIIFDKIKATKTADFLWDYDKFYIENSSHEAGTFIRENINRYGNSNPHNKDNFKSKKRINVINAPSDAMQCKYVWDFLKQCQEEHGELNRETAIILTDESLLIPVLYSIPKEIKNFNITAGYPITLSGAYTLFEYLVRLFLNHKTEQDSTVHHSETILAILAHPVIATAINLDSSADALLNEIEQQKSRFIKFSTSNDTLIDTLFNIKQGVHISQYLLDALTTVGKRYYEFEDNKINLEFMYRVVEEIRQTNNIFQQTNFTPSANIYVSAVRKHLQSSSVPFNGEPLIGVQIMGILETRNIDFKNVLILSMNDENYPGSSVRKSYIPHSLRLGYCLPTQSYQEAMYTYYFYRLIQRAQRVDIAYCSSSVGMKNGEISRYIHQIKYEKSHLLNMVNLSLNVNVTEPNDQIEKDEQYKKYVDSLTSLKSALSPSAIDNWISCQVKFYYKYILKIRPKIAPETSLSSMDFGNAVHNTLENIYEQAKGGTNHDIVELLKSYIETPKIDTIIDIWIENNFPSMAGSGAIDSAKRFISSYIISVIKFDINRTDDFSVVGVEQGIGTEIEVGEQSIRLYGNVDRIDSTSRGYMITDYKTGRKTNSTNTIASLFDSSKTPNKAYLQSLIYCYIFFKEENKNVFPSLYFTKEMNDIDYQNKLYLTDRGADWTIDNIESVYEEVETNLKELISQIIDTSTPLKKTTIDRNCDYCDYKVLCMK